MGGVVRRVVAGDTVPAAGVRVTLHRVAREAQGPADSLVVGADGRFGFRVARDPTALWLVSAAWGGMEYFGDPIPGDRAAGADDLVLLVYDTSPTAPVTVATRRLVVGHPEADGGRLVRDLLVLRNAGAATRVAADGDASFALPLAAGVTDVEPVIGDLAPGAVVLERDTLRLLAPVLPGERELGVAYEVHPARDGVLRLPLPPTAEPVVLYLEDAAVPRGGWVLRDSQAIDGAMHRQWEAASDTRELVLGSPSRAAQERQVLPWLVVALTLLFGGAVTWAVRRQALAPRRGDA